MYDVSAAARAERPFEVWAPWSTTYTTLDHPSRTSRPTCCGSAPVRRRGGRAWPACRCRCSTTSTSPRRVLRASRPPAPRHRHRPARHRRRARPRRRPDRADDLAVLPRRRARHRRGVPGRPRLRARHRRDVRGCATSWSPSPPGRRWRPRPRHTTPATGSSPGRTGSPSRWSRATATWARRSTTRRRWASWTSRRRSGRPSGSRERDDRFVATGRHQFGVLAYAADGTCVATTELFVNEVASWRALQGGTLVVPGHRGHRLGLALKLANLRAVRERFPDCRYVFTAVRRRQRPDERRERARSGSATSSARWRCSCRL